MSYVQRLGQRSNFQTWFQMEVPLFFEIPALPFNTIQDKPKIVFVPKTVVMDEQTYIRASTESRDKDQR